MKKINRNAGRIAFFIGPSLAGFSLFYLAPFLISILSSLVDSPFTMKFAGLANYINLVKNSVFRRALMNTFLFTGTAVPLTFILSLTLAIIMNRAIYRRRVFRTLIITPLVCPTASVVVVWQSLFNRDGIVNALLERINFTPVDWFNSEYSLLIIVTLFLWKTVGYNMILFIAGLNTIPHEYYDVARSFGAGNLFIFFRITMVYLFPSAFFVVILSIVNSFKIFREIFLLTGVYPDSSLYMIQHYINNCFNKLDLQKMSSASILFSLLIFILVYILFRKGRPELING